jgi:hypothetical protein
MLRQPPSQPQSPHQLGMSQQYDPFETLPTSSRLPNDNMGWPNQHTSRMPQQYAYPLARHNSYSVPGAQKGLEPTSSRQPAEHMLRRKTPNGVLPAAYDSSGGDTTIQQPTKHILLPVTADHTPTPSSRSGYFSKHDLPLRAFTFDGQSHGLNQPNSHYGPRHDADFKSRPRHVPQIDSVLNQIPAHYPQLTYQPGGPQFFGAVQQPLQSPLGPTVSNEQLSYGPYWPNGTFLPYQPAEKRDPRYMPAHPSPWMPQPLGAYGHAGLRDWPNAGPPGLAALQGYNSGHATPLPTPLDFSNNSTPIDQSYARGFHQPTHPRPHPSLISPTKTSDPFSGFGLPHSADSSGQSTPHAYPSASTPFHDLTANSRNPEVRERIFTWAHGIYVEFLEHLHKHRKILLQQKQLHGIKEPIRPSIYPKPPRQPLFNFIGTNDGRKHSESTHRHQNAAFGANNFPSRGNLARASSLQSAHPPQFLHNDPHRRLSWQQQPTQSMLSHQPAPNPYRSLRRTSGNSIANVMSPQHMSPDTSPTSSANSALDALTKVCNDNDWRWVEGLLLAGCFAYCLGDYEKAFQFYSKILDLEPK